MKRKERLGSHLRFSFSLVESDGEIHGSLRTGEQLLGVGGEGRHTKWTYDRRRLTGLLAGVSGSRQTAGVYGLRGREVLQ